MPSQAVIDNTKKFLKLYGKDIATAIANTNLFFAAVVGQKCNESGYGTSNIAKNGYNFGGIRGRPQEAIGKTSNGWAIFATPYDCFKCYVRFILSKPQYAKVLLATSPEEQIKALVNAGYCEIITNKNSAGYMPSADYYLKRCQGAVDVTRDVCPTGKITSDNLALAIAQLQTNAT